MRLLEALTARWMAHPMAINCTSSKYLKYTLVKNSQNFTSQRQLTLMMLLMGLLKVTESSEELS